MSYRVQLPVFSGPMDLLLHLVRQQEVDIHEVRISDILEHYLAHLKVLEALDLGDLGDFLVMASTLMEIKSREILPREHVEISAELDPKDDLIRRLLEYKRYRDISRRLDRLAKRRSKMLEAVIPPSKVERVEETEPLLDLGEIEIWSLTAAFAKLLEATGHRENSYRVGVDRKNVNHYAAHVLERIRPTVGAAPIETHFESLFDPLEGRYGIIGVFIAILELMKQGVLRAYQGDKPGDIRMTYVGDPSLTADQILSGGERLDENDETTIEDTLGLVAAPQKSRRGRKAAGPLGAARASVVELGAAAGDEGDVGEDEFDDEDLDDADFDDADFDEGELDEIEFDADAAPRRSPIADRSRREGGLEHGSQSD